MRRRRMHAWGLIVAASCALAVGAAVAGAETTIAPEERVEVERRVEEIERQFRALRDQKLARCRGTWTLCINKRCKQIRFTESARWQTCQDECDAQYERCQGVAYEIWPDGS